MMLLRGLLRSSSSLSHSHLRKSSVFDWSSLYTGLVSVESRRTFFKSLTGVQQNDDVDSQLQQQQGELQQQQEEHKDAGHKHEFPTFDNLNQLLHYADINASTLQSSSLAQLTTLLADLIGASDPLQQQPVQLEEDQSLRRIMTKLSESLSLMNVTDCICVLQSLSKIKKRLPPGSTTVNETGIPILKRLVRRELQAKPDQLAYLCYYLEQAGIVDLSFHRYLREATPPLCDLLSLAGVRTMLRVLYNMDMRESALVTPLSDRLTNGIDFFDNEDVVDTFRLDLETNMVNRPCYLKLTDLVFKHFELFSTNELVELFSLTCSLQCLNPLSARDILSSLQSKINVLNDQQILQILVGMMQIGEKYYDVASPFLNTILLKRPISAMTADEAIKVLYTICHYEAQDYKTELENLLQHYIANLPEKIPPEHLTMMSEITVSIENEFEGVKQIEIPERLRESTDRHALSVAVDWRIKKNVLQLQEKLPESHAVQLEPDVVVGPYVASFVDEGRKLILEINMPKSPVGIAMRKRHLERLGYAVVRLSGKAMLHTRIPDALLEILTRAFDGHAMSSGKTSRKDVTARKESYRL